MDVIVFPTPGLGDRTYLLAADGVGVLVDPQRDADRFLALAAERGIVVRWVVETHVHNDYVSGAREAARFTGANLVLPAGAGAAYPHIPAFHLEDIPIADAVTLRPLHTPGHTPEHVSYVVREEGRDVAVFSGGSLLAGSAGRTDLLGSARAHQLAVAQHGSLRRLASLPAEAALYPTHGQGSFCGASDVDRDPTTVGAEQADNPLLAHTSAEAFAAEQLAGLGPYPAYYRHMGPLNVLGPPPRPAGRVPEIGPDEVDPATAVIDARETADFAAGHLAGSIGITLSPLFGVWVGWVVPFGSPLTLVLDDEQDLTEARTALARVGYDDVVGVVRASGLQRGSEPLRHFMSVGAGTFAEAVRSGSASQVLDVRAPAEWEDGSLPGAVRCHVPDLLATQPAFDSSEMVWVACASGFRAAIAASLLERVGYAPVVLTSGGIPEVREQLGSDGADHPRHDLGRQRHQRQAPARMGRPADEEEPAHR